MERPTTLRVAHLVDAMGGSGHLYGKEWVVVLLMREQRASGLVDPMLITFSPGPMAELLATEGFRVASLSASPRRSHGFDHATERLAALLEEHPVDVLHSHEYRANIIARFLRLSGRARGVRLVSTCHGWVETTAKLRLNNIVDRLSTSLSDITTVPDARMLASLPWPARSMHIPNAVADLDPNADVTPFFSIDGFVVGTLSRVVAKKGIYDLLAAAVDFPDPSVVFAVAGDGELTPVVEQAGGNVRYVGYCDRAPRFLAGLDVYLQPSHHEGLSLSLLEAMRAGKPIVATAVGGTCDAVTDGESALIVPPRQPEALRAAILRLRQDPALAARLGRNARSRFEAEFRIERQSQRYLDLYHGVTAVRRATGELVARS